MISLPGGYRRGMSFWVILRLVAAPALAFDDFHAAVEAAGHDVPVMEEGVLLEADVHEGRFEAVLEVADLAFEDAADQALLGGALDGELLEPAVLETATRVSSDSALMMTSLWIFLTGLIRRWTFLTSVVARDPEGVDESLGRILCTGTGSKGFSSSTCAGVSGLGSRNLRLAGAGRSGGGLGPLPRAGGRRRCFRRGRFPAACRPLIAPSRAPRAARRLGAGFRGFAVGFVARMAQPAAGAETHAAAASPGKISVTHKLIGLSIDIHVLQHAHGDQRAEH